MQKTWAVALRIALVCLGANGAVQAEEAAPDLANLRYSPLKEITTENVSRLTPVWTFSTGVLRGHEGAPLVVGGVIYVHTPFPNIVYALDLDHDGKILWKYEPRQDAGVVPLMCCDTISRGLAYGDGKIFLYQADTTLVALDAKTGAPVWSVKNGDPAKGATGTSAPALIKDKVLVGVSGGEFGFRGYLTAYDVKTGAKLWRAYSVGPDADTLIDPEKTTELGKPVGKESSLASWQGDQWKIGGGAPWGRISYDAAENLIYYGTGNPSTWNPTQRPGDNKWSMAIFARDVDTGVARWVYQMTPHDEWDYDGVNEMILTDASGGRKVLTHFDRNGFAYVLDRADGDLISADKYDPAVNWASRIDMDKSSKSYGRPIVDGAYSTQQNGEETVTHGVCPSTVGAKNANPAAYSALTGLFYAPMIRLCMDYEPFQITYAAGQPYTGADTAVYPEKGETNMGALIGWDAASKRVVWSDPEPFAVASGVLATAGGLVFYGTLEGYLKAVDARSGKELYRFKTPSGIIGDVTSFERNGRQYIAVLSGAGGWSGVGLTAGLTHSDEGANSPGVYAALANYTALGGQLTVFALK
ncbi:PQQ-dependent dehydrogenase, methanol/ethanol family [Methylocella tundrae]|uniref:Methanol dehydrogenase Lanthanide-dependent XoxF (XoxF5-2) n=1 Tax=Methylocella tundrae TaxID=227605 RepID=A0A4V6IN02_METTU|nr:PQQ-dependent dehydrogenase, methanol/ethanol family [Methylocella tundrae]WPP04325.1 PQQ-dependent dehydrogenase, methanol/ethanol family [Methylocella tundrae]VFU10658.1 Methanol dehydrogenase Lanthanide-dependent XoxF (XoxF5-2) [Methylocella tundrae]